MHDQQPASADKHNTALHRSGWFKVSAAVLAPEVAKQVTKSDLMVYMALCKFRNNDSGVCWPSLKTIAKDASVCEKTATRAVAKLEALGLIEAEHRRRVGNVYSLPITDRSASVNEQGKTDAAMSL